MNDVNAVLAEAKCWLAEQPNALEGSATWYGFNNFRKFIASIDADPSPSGIERACHALGWHIGDQWGGYDELPIIAQFNDRFRQISKVRRQTP
ncbi:hypothetical protein [Novosphingobium soli]|uniref:Uncharacterized protein n=1 Tax=Novosphingobium soli TaxID=574956 RepID=A0ABV6CTY5_9SPHN